MNSRATLTAEVPMQVIGPVKITGETLNEEVRVPLATFESPLWPSTGRGARISRLAGGIQATVIDERMTRSVLFEADNASLLQHAAAALPQHMPTLQQITQASSRFAKLIDTHTQIVGNLLFLRFEFTTGDASGHNMVTHAADQLMSWLLVQHPALRYVSISGNFCTDKKVSCVNGILGRGKHVVAELRVPRKLCEEQLRTTPEQIVALNIKKNLIGSIVAGGVRSANAHFANMLLGFYLATGQDVANIVEGSQGIVHAEVDTINDALYFSVTLPNIIVGTVGNGKDIDYVRKNLALMDCLAERPAGENARRLAVIGAATVLCCELSLLAAQTNPGELMQSHIELERNAEKEEETALETRGTNKLIIEASGAQDSSTAATKQLAATDRVSEEVE